MAIWNPWTRGTARTVSNAGASGHPSPTPPGPLEAALHAAVERCFLQAEAHYQRSFARPRVTLGLRGMAAAMAHCTDNALRFNRVLLERNHEDFLAVTVPHEVSHLLAYRLHGRRIAPHGAEWRAIMQEVFGLPALRCHDYDVRPGMKKAYHYRCGCEHGHILSTRRHNSAEHGRRYHCRRCRQPLSFSHQETMQR